jgi:hypothetical protein
MSEKPRHRVKAPTVKMRPGDHLGVVIPIEPRSLPSVYEALDTINDLVDQGIVDGIAIAVTYHNGGSGSCFGQGPNRMALVGEMQMLTHRMVSGFHSEREANN